MDCFQRIYLSTTIKPYKLQLDTLTSIGPYIENIEDTFICLVLSNLVKELIAKAKAKYYQDAIIECSDSKSQFRVMDHLLKRKSEPKLPSFTSAEDLSNRFANYFLDKITNIRTVILEKQKQDDYDYEPPSVNTPNLISFDILCPVTVEEICKTIMCCPTTSCVLDPLPKQSLTTNVDNLITCYHTNSQFISNHWKISFFTKISNNNTIAKEGLTRSGIIENFSSCV